MDSRKSNIQPKHLISENIFESIKDNLIMDNGDKFLYRYQTPIQNWHMLFYKFYMNVAYSHYY